MIKKISWGKILFYIYISLVFLFLIFPIFIVIPISFNDSNFLHFPPKGFSVKWYTYYFHDKAWLSATWLSVRVGIFTMILATVLGTIASFGLVRGNFPGKNLLNAFIASPMIVPIIIISIAIYSVFSQFKLIGSVFGLVLAHTVLAIPFVVSNVSAVLRTFDISLEHASINLGASKLTTFFRVVLPNIKSGVISGALFAFIISFDELVVTMFIAGVNHTLPTKMFSDIRTEIDPTIAAISTLIIILSIIILLGSSIFNKNDEKID